MLKYTAATVDDLPTIVSIYNSTIASRMVTADTELVTIEQKMDWFNMHNNNRPLWMVEDQHAACVGWVSFQDFYSRPAYNGTAEISIYLQTNCRGKGYGKLILNHCIQNAPTLKIHTLLGYIFSHNIPSAKLFSNAGFKEWGIFKDIAIMDDKAYSLTIWGLKVM